ncbi:MAG: hypothetical protein P1V35_03785 [Planctomycetota bacterium]|nr:hypothetical protein [Planctomycetota bacterium]
MMTQQSNNFGNRSVRRRGDGLTFATASLLIWTGCASPAIVAPKPLELGPPAGMQTHASQFVGSLLSGPQDGEYQTDRLVACMVEVCLLRDAPGSTLDPLAPELGLVARLQGQTPVQGGSRLAVGGRWALGVEADAAWSGITSGDWGDTKELESQAVLLPLGTTYRLKFSAEEQVEDPENFLREWPDRGAVQKSLSVGIQYGWIDSKPSLLTGFALGDLVQAESETELTTVPDEGGRPGGDFLMEEWILPSRGPELNGGSVVWVLPSPFELQGAGSVAIRVRTWAGDEENVDPQLLESSLALLESGAQGKFATDGPETEEQAIRRQRVRAMQYVRETRERHVAGEPGQGEALRNALVYVCSQVALPLGMDLCIAAEVDWLNGWVALIPDPSLRDGATVDALGWDVERAAWVHLARTMVKGDLPDSLMALVLRHGGEAGHYPSSLEDAARNSLDAATFEARIEMENRLFLEDASPAARVRAFDWLQRRGLEPSDWDPLGTKEERTAPLREWLTKFENGEGA